MRYLQSLAVFTIAAGVTFLELVTSKYPRTLFLAATSPSLYVYACIYGLFGVAMHLAYPFVLATGVPDEVHVAGAPPSVVPWSSNPWLRAGLIGLTLKALLHVRIFEIKINSGKSVPIGIETLTQLFEPLLLRNIEIDHWMALARFVEPAATKYGVLSETWP